MPSQHTSKSPDRRSPSGSTLSLPYSSRMRVFRWFKERFGLKQRKLFWVVFVAMLLFTVLTSGVLLSFCIYGSLFVLSGIPFIRPWVSGALEPMQVSLGHYVAFTKEHSPTDLALNAIWSGLWHILSDSYVNQLICTVIPLIALYLMIRVMSRPGRLLLNEQGIWLSWTFPFSITGPVVPWSSIKQVSFHRPKGTTTQRNSFITFECKQLPFLYRLAERVSVATKGCICLRLQNIESDRDREALSRMLQTNAPAVEPAVLESLTPAQNQSYTELWLGAMTAPSKRERAEPLRSGMKLGSGRFEIVGQLGVGGQGTAYLANCGNRAPNSANEDHPDSDSSQSSNIVSNTSGDIVLKEFVLPLYVDTDSRKNVLEKFVKEADILKKLDNPRIVKLIDCFVEDHRGYLVLERIKGASLREIVLSKGPMSELQVSSLLHQMCEMLVYLHGQSPPVVHRDFAPDNLILGDDGTLTLVDFNVAQQTEDSFTGTIVGKQSYVPPEQLRGMATAQSDIYALGATLYFLLTGEDPEPLSVSHPRERAPHVSEQFDAIVSQCTQLEEETRFKSAAEIASSLRISVPLAEEVEKQKR